MHCPNATKTLRLPRIEDGDNIVRGIVEEPDDLGEELLCWYALFPHWDCCGLPVVHSRSRVGVFMLGGFYK